MNEFENISNLMAVIGAQNYENYELWVCVNQSESYWDNADKLPICTDNQKTLNFLKTFNEFPIQIIDKSSRGKAWDKKNFGVGWARKTLMDAIALKADENDIILTLDGDTTIKPSYLSSIAITINSFPKAVALSIPYYHPLSGDEETDRNILRYEIYMRYYSLNLWRINNPYNFTALGSAMAVPVWAYNRVRGITPHKSGEDFYFLLKLRKFGEIINWNPEKVYPAARYSDRVFFGTGPAMIKGRSGDWSSYPFYDYKLFDEVKESFEAFTDLFDKDVDYPMKSFLNEQFKDDQWYLKLRKNNPSLKRFVKACIDKVDALRILQFLKSSQIEKDISLNDNLVYFLEAFYPSETLTNNFSTLDFDNSSVKDLNALRDFMIEKEEEHQKNDWNK